MPGAAILATMAANDALPVAAILAGGRGRRLGRPKPTAALGGRPLIEYPLAAARDAGLQAVVVAKPASALPPLEVPVWREPAAPWHPLCGLVCALSRAAGRPVLAVACDMPFVTAPLLGALSRGGGAAVVPRAGGRLHPLLARYGPEALPPLTAALEQGAAMHAAVAAVGVREIDEAELTAFGDPRRLLLNVNTPADLALAEGLLRER